MKKSPRIKSLTIAAIAAQVGCISLILIFTALFVGLWLDAQSGRRGVFTVILLVVSAPINIYLMLRIALGLIRRIQPQAKDEELLDSSLKEVSP